MRTGAFTGPLYLRMENTEAALPQEPIAESAPAPQAEETKPAGQEQTEQPKAEKPPETEEQKQSRGVQKRLDELRRQAGDAQRMNERLLALMEKTLSGQAPKVEAPKGPPRREDFENYEAYLEARTDFQFAEKLKEVEAKASATRQEQALREREKTWQQKQAKASEKYEDFVDVTMAEDLAITPAMAEAIRDSEEGPEVAYYLGKNPQEAKRIAALSPAAQVREIGKIEARLELKASEPVRKPSKAPPPIDPIGQGKASSSNDPAQMTQAEYEAWRKKQGAVWAR